MGERVSLPEIFTNSEVATFLITYIIIKNM
jgi:hypothetical protein